MTQTRAKKRSLSTIFQNRKAAAVVAMQPGDSARLFAAGNAWLVAHLETVVWLIVLVAFYLRLERAGGTYFNADEAQIMFPALQSDLSQVYKAWLIFPYGPLLGFLLHLMTFFGSSEVFFRLPSVVAGALIPYVAYRWVAETFNKAAGLVTALILCFSPALVILSAQVRPYMLHMFFLVCSLYCLERAFREKSAVWMRWFGFALLLALLTMYMSIWYTAAIDMYALLRIMRNGLPRRIVVEWAVFQVLAVMLLILAYATHLRTLRGSQGEVFARAVWLYSSYFHPDSQNPVKFLGGASKRLFSYFFSNSSAGPWMMLAFITGVVLILCSKSSIPGNRKLAVLSLLLPPFVTAVAALFSLYPYGGSRHDAFLSVFLAAGIGTAVAFAAGQNVMVLLLAAALLAPAWLNAEQHHYLDDFPQISKLEQMHSALKYLSTRSPRVRVLVVDELGESLVKYYVCRGNVMYHDRRSATHVLTYWCADYEVLAIQEWGVPYEALQKALNIARATLPTSYPDPVWGFYVYSTLTPAVTMAGKEHAVFGKIDIRQISP